MSFTPEWCIGEGNVDCRFYGTKDCDDCKSCTLCRAKIGPKGRNRNKAHLWIAQSKGGRHWVPTCQACNHSQSDKALFTWLKHLRKEKREIYDMILRAQRNMTPKIAFHLNEKPRILLGARILRFDKRLRKR